MIGPAPAGDILRAFVAASFSGEEHHRRRLAKVLEIERSQGGVVEQAN